MRLFYLLIKISLRYSLLFYFKRTKTVRFSKGFFGSTIYVSNHPASFMDPLVIPVLTNPIMFFMVRSDVFTPLTRPFFWMIHMIPIYRQHDGGNTKDRNKGTFDAAAKILASGRNLLVFGEGFTDDVFIRRLKPIKKGAVRMGFHSLESIHWKKKIYIAAVGNNYTDPNTMRSEIVISKSKKICLNDFKEEYQKNPVKVINEVTLLVEKLMKEEITHVEKEELCVFHEQIMMITRKGMNVSSSNQTIPIQNRWKYSQHLALWINSHEALSGELQNLKEELDRYFALLNKMKLRDELIYQKTHQKGQMSRFPELTKLILFFPSAIIGFIHCAPLYYLIKRFVERTFKRKVFWGSAKMVIALFAMGLVNIPAIFLFHSFIYESWLLAFAYYFMIPVFGLYSYEWFHSLKLYKEKGIVNKVNTETLERKRQEIGKKIHELIPVA